MAREYRPNAKEFSVISKLDQAKENQRINALHLLREHIDDLSSRIGTKLIEERLVETLSKEDLDDQLHRCLEALLTAEDFDVQFQTANFRNLVPRPHFVSLYVTAFIIEKLIDHKSTVEIYGTDEEIYRCVNNQVWKLIPM
jgi:hypothetical protein